MSTFKEFLKANRALKYDLSTPTEKQGIALIDAHQAHVFYLYSIIKIGAIFAHLNQLRPVLYPSIRFGNKQRAIINSLSRELIKSRLTFLRCALPKLPTTLLLASRLKTKQEVVDIQINDVKIGPYIFDSIYQPMMRGIGFKQRIKIIYLVLCHWMDRQLIDRSDVKLVIIGESGYRTGMLFELCRARRIKCIHAINADIFQMHKYYSVNEFGCHYRDVPESLLSLLEQREDVPGRVDSYLTKRFKGAVTQHDAIRAYSSQKLTRSKAELVEDYGLDPTLPLVFVMAHVFSDAPHAYPKMLYTDYEEWLKETVKALAQNKHINFLIKEHPTADLFFEAGIMGRILDSLGQRNRLLKSNVHTQTVHSNASAILTCGGTIGIEASVRGIPVFLAARPPYSGKGFTHEYDTIADYEGHLVAGIEHAAPLTEPQVRRAKNVAYAMFELFDNDGRSIETGGVPNVWGTPFDEEAFYRGVVAESAVPIVEQRIYAAIKRFENAPDTSMINHNKLNMPASLP